jgi:hypothetical protein
LEVWNSFLGLRTAPSATGNTFSRKEREDVFFLILEKLIEFNQIWYKYNFLQSVKTTWRVREVVVLERPALRS